MERQSRLRRVFSSVERPSCFTLALIPFVYLVSLVVQYTVDVPVWDQWCLVPLIEKSYQGTLSIHDLWTQHNEHRILFPRIIMLILARISGWSTSYELAVNLLFAAGILAVSMYQTRITLKCIGNHGTNWLLPITSLMVFSLNQWENWLWGWQMTMLLNVFAVVTGIILLANPEFRWSRFLVALLLGVVATYSFANGIMYWPIGLLLLFLASPKRKSSVALWVAAGLITVSSYLYDYQKPPHHPSIWIILKQPIGYSKYVFSYLGASVVNFSMIGAFVVGLLGSIGFWCMIWLLVRRRYRFQVLTPYVGLSLYSIGSALITGIARVGFGSAQAMTSRYMTISSPFWFSNIVLLYSIASSNDLRTKSHRKNALQRYALFSIIILLVLLIALSSIYARPVFDKRHDYLLPARDALLVVNNSAKSDDLLKRLFVNTDMVKEGADVLKRYHLSVFRDSAH